MSSPTVPLLPPQAPRIRQTPVTRTDIDFRCMVLLSSIDVLIAYKAQVGTSAFLGSRAFGRPRAGSPRPREAAGPGWGLCVIRANYI